MPDLITLAQLVGAVAAVVAAAFSVATWLRERAWEKPICFISSRQIHLDGSLSLEVEIRNGSPLPISIEEVRIYGGTHCGNSVQDCYGGVTGYERTALNVRQYAEVIAPQGSSTVWCAVHFKSPSVKLVATLSRIGFTPRSRRYRLAIRPAR